VRRIDAVLKQAETKFALGRHAEQVQGLEAIRDIIDAVDAPRRAAWYYWTGFLHSLTGAPVDVSIGYCRTAAEIAEQEGLDELRAYAQCCLAHVYLFSGDLQDALKAGEWALDTFEAEGNRWWACRTLWGLLPVTNALGDWERALAYCERALQHATAMDDARLKVVAHLRRGATHVQRGDPLAALEACRQAEALGPGPFDEAMLKAVRGQALIKGPDVAAGVAMLEEMVAWFTKSNLRYTRTYAALFLAEGYLRHGDGRRARVLAEEALLAARERRYWHLEGVAERVLGEALIGDDRQAANEHLEAAAVILAAVGARNDLAKAWATQAMVRHEDGNVASGLSLARRALALFEELGTLHEPTRLRSWLGSVAA
jgi:tetratricopeptide (TPR) repeat protein